MPRGLPCECVICSQMPDIKHQCPNCNKAPYCSVECRQTDAPIHDMLCSSTQAFAVSPPEPSIRAIIFPSLESKPRFTFVKLDMAVEPWLRPIGHITELLGNHPNELPNIQMHRIDRNDMRNVDVFEYGIFMFWREEETNRKQSNKALRTVVEECRKFVSSIP